jgi:GNAT superfamily N-acetyltransferase
MTNPFQVLRIDSTTPVDSYLWDTIRPLVETTEDLYPGIDLWLRRKVKPGLKDGSRLCYAIVRGDQPQAIAILKRGANSKLCTLRVAPDAVGRRLGTALMLLIVSELLQASKRAHFTIPESVWFSCSSFYESFGFEMKGYADESYRKGDRELVCGASRIDMVEACRGMVHKLYRPRLQERTDSEPDRDRNLQDRLALLGAQMDGCEHSPGLASPSQLPRDLTLWYEHLTIAEASFKTTGLIRLETTEDDWAKMRLTKTQIDSRGLDGAESENCLDSSDLDGPRMVITGTGQWFSSEPRRGPTNSRIPVEELLASLSRILQTVHSSPA